MDLCAMSFEECSGHPHGRAGTCLPAGISYATGGTPLRRWELPACRLGDRAYILPVGDRIFELLVSPMVGLGRFELPASCTPCKRATPALQPDHGTNLGLSPRRPRYPCANP